MAANLLLLSSNVQRSMFILCIQMTTITTKLQFFNNFYNVNKFQTEISARHQQTAGNIPVCILSLSDQVVSCGNVQEVHESSWWSLMEKSLQPAGQVTEVAKELLKEIYRKVLLFLLPSAAEQPLDITHNTKPVELTNNVDYIYV